MTDPVPKADYRAYFQGILDLAARHGVALHGLTVPGCCCEECQTAYDALEAAGPLALNPAALAALLDLAEEGRIAARSIAIFETEADAQGGAGVILRRGDRTIVDLRPNTATADRMGYDGLYDPDHNITADGTAGRVVDLVGEGTAYCFLCAHRYAMNPEMPQGWGVFREVLTRIDRHLRDWIEWVSPSAFGNRLAGQNWEGADVSQG